MKPMTTDEYELARVAHGVDMAKWPDDLAERARLFLTTDEGAAFAAAELALDAGLSALYHMDAKDTAGADAFLDRLLDIPTEQTSALPATDPGFIVTLAGLYRDFRNLFSPVGLMSQGIAYALVLFVGVFVGMQQPYDEESSVDLSSALFTSSTDLYLEDQ